MVLGWFRDCIYMVNAPEFTWAPACKKVLSHHVEATVGTRMYAQKLETRERETERAASRERTAERQREKEGQSKAKAKAEAK